MPERKQQKRVDPFAPGIVRSISIDVPEDSRNRYPYNIPAIQGLRNLRLHPAVTYLTGENGTGKSTLIEAIAIAAGMNAEGGSRNHHFATRSTESSLYKSVTLARGVVRERDSFFMRAETMYNLATYNEQIGIYGSGYGGTTLHNLSHGEALIALVSNRFRGRGLYILDEPESALSPSRQVQFLELMHAHCQKHGSQFIIATHSPLLITYTNSSLYELSDDGIRNVEYTDTDLYRTMRDFILGPELFLHHLFAEY